MNLSEKQKSGLLVVSGLGLGLLALSDVTEPKTDKPKTATRPLRPASKTARVAGEQFIRSLLKYVKVPPIPWCMGGTGDSCFDCSGFGYMAANDLGVEIPRTASGQSKASAPTHEWQAARIPGALVIFERKKDKAIRHVEYSLGNGLNTVASQVKGGVKIYKWGWWNYPKQKKLWNIYYGLLPNFT